MKVKGIGALERHIEKIVVGVVGLAAFGALAWQFVGPANTVKVGSDTVPAADALRPVLRAAETLKGEVDSTSPRLPEAAELPDLLGQFRTRLTAGVAPADRIAALGPAVTIGAASGPVVGDVLYAERSPAAPEPPVASSHRSTISPFEWISNPELRKLLPAEQPFDKASVSVQSRFDGKALAQLLAEDPDSDGPLQALPPQWWRGTLEILGVEAQRQRLDVEGNWVDDGAVAPIPGRPNLLADVASNVKAPGDLPIILDRARRAGDRIHKPPFLAILAGEPWVEPVVARAQSQIGPDREVQSLIRQRAEVNSRIQRVDRALQQAAQPTPTRPERGEGGGGGGGKGGGGRVSTPSPRQGEAPGQPSPQDAQRARLEKQREEALLQLEEIDKALTEAGVGPDGRRLSEEQLRAAGSAERQLVPPLLDNPQFSFWTHDLTVEPGASYRYRVRLVLNNPYFGQQRLLKPEQHALAESPVWPTAWSDWSEAVEVDRMENVFVTSASTRDALGGPKAQFEVFRFYYGFDRRTTIPAEPGDLLTAEVRPPQDLKVFDLAKLESAAPLQGPQGAPPPDAPPAPPGRFPGEMEPRRPGGKDGGAPGPGRLIAPGDDRRAAPPPGPEPEFAPPGQDLWAQAEGAPVPRTIPVQVGALLLDVAEAPQAAVAALPGQSVERQFLAVLRDRTGQIVVRSPSQDRSTQIYARVSASARLGEKQTPPGQIPAATPGGPQDPSGPPGVPPPPTEPEPTGGGGGGG